jgi:peroxiredoxin
MLRILFAALAVSLCSLALASLTQADTADKPDVSKLNKKIDSFSLSYADDKAFSLHAIKDKKAVVVVFLSFDCPVSNSYSSYLAQLHKTHAKDVAFVGINSSDDVSAADIEKSARDYKLPFPVLKDQKHKVADQFKAKIAPEVFVLDHNFVLRYRGRIDNTWSARLKKNTQTTDFDLQNALTDLLAGKDVRTPATKAVGCPIRRDSVTKADGKVTYHRDVLPILQNSCQSCHRPGEVGPFSLMTYKQAVNWAEDIKQYTQERKMPPFKVTEGIQFHNDRRLSEKQIATLAAWVDGGTPEGDPKDAPKPVTFNDGWQLGTPDLILTVAEDMHIGPSGKDLFRCFVLPTNLTEDKFVTAVEVRPGNKRVVHHTLNFFDLSGKARELAQKEKDRPKKPDEADHGPGYSVAMGLGFIPTFGKFGGLSGWAPGQQANFLPDGYGFPLPKGADVVVQTHYHRNGRAEKDRLSIGLYFAKKPNTKPWKNGVIPGSFLVIPAGAENFKVNGTIVAEEDGDLRSIMPHMHMLGRKIKVTMTPPEGQAKTLLAITDWDYNWQETYFLKESIPFKKGTKFEVEAIYDNSKKNPNNPFNPPQWVRFGEQTDNEMCFVFLGLTNDKPSPRFPFKTEGLAIRPRLMEKPKEDK